MIFSRSRGSGRHAAGRQTRDQFGSEPATDDGYPDGDPPEYGPFDASEAPTDVERLDLGSLRIPAVDGVEVRLQADPDGQVQQVMLVCGESALQLGVFAAPRSEGIWDEVRGDIRSQLFTDGVAAEETDGEYGTELHARVRSPEGLTDLRFIGVDGPRWMVRAVYQGAAAVDPMVAAPLAECLRGVVVERGSEAMPVREPLPLKLPREIAERAAASRSEDGADEVAPADATAHSGEQRRARPAPRGARKPSPRPRRTR